LKTIASPHTPAKEDFFTFKQGIFGSVNGVPIPTQNTQIELSHSQTAQRNHQHVHVYAAALTGSARWPAIVQK
jgi:hypothetical protein